MFIIIMVHILDAGSGFNFQLSVSSSQLSGDLVACFVFP